MSVDWSQFRDGDKVRVTFEGTWEDDGIRLHLGYLGWLAVDGTLKSATSAELIERPFTPPPAGKLFVAPGDVLGMSLGTKGYRVLRTHEGDPVNLDFPWLGISPEWKATIEVLDI